MRLHMFVMLVLAACGARSSDPASSGGQAASLACPASYAAAQSLQVRCTADGAPSCAYAEGTCGCAPAPPPCRGTKPPDDDRGPAFAWRCAPAPDASGLRPDGCPIAEPSGACTQEGLGCGYGDCCVAIYTCTNGAWVQGKTDCPA